MTVRPESVKLLGENIRGSKLLDSGPGNEFLDLAPKPKATKSRNKEVGLHPTTLVVVFFYNYHF